MRQIIPHKPAYNNPAAPLCRNRGRAGRCDVAAAASTA